MKFSYAHPKHWWTYGDFHHYSIRSSLANSGKFVLTIKDRDTDEDVAVVSAHGSKELLWLSQCYEADPYNAGECDTRLSRALRLLTTIIPPTTFEILYQEEERAV